MKDFVHTLREIDNLLDRRSELSDELRGIHQEIDRKKTALVNMLNSEAAWNDMAERDIRLSHDILRIDCDGVVTIEPAPETPLTIAGVEDRLSALAYERQSS